MLSNYSLVIGSTAALTEIDQEPLMQESFIRHLQLLAIACKNLEKVFFSVVIGHAMYRSMEFCHLCVRQFDRSNVNTMKLDDFIQCCVMLKSLTDAFRKRDSQQTGVITISYEQVILVPDSFFIN
jgi:hypothetical protein